MDLKIQSIAWVGTNISQKFETMCQQVDNIVSQDTVKYVENQIQTMGGSVKRFCSDVVLDLLPSSVDPVKNDAQEVVLKRNDVLGTYLKSAIGIEKCSMDAIIGQLHKEPNPVEHMKNQLGHAVGELYHENQLITPVSVDPIDGQESNSVSGKAVDILTHESSDEDAEENAIKSESATSEVLELMSFGKMDLSEASISRESRDSNNKNAHRVVVEISCANSVDVVECRPTQIVDTVTSCKKNLLETRLISSSDPRLKESNNLQKDSLDYLTAKTIICSDAVDRVGWAYDSCEAIPSSNSSPIVSHKDKEAEAELINSNSVLSLESSKEEVSGSNYVTSLSEISRKTNCEFCGSAQSEAVAISLDNGPSHDFGADLEYSGMETIELCDNVKQEDSCVMVDNSALYAVSCRTQKLRSFKKMIQDAFVSKKRLAKEYEQLAIWFGDVYMGPEPDPLQSLLPATSSATLESETSNASHTCDSEWELL